MSETIGQKPTELSIYTQLIRANVNTRVPFNEEPVLVWPDDDIQLIEGEGDEPHPWKSDDYISVFYSQYVIAEEAMEKQQTENNA